MVFRSFVAIAGVLAMVVAAEPSSAATEQKPPTQRHIVFSIHQDITTRRIVRQETDISQAFNGTGASNHVGAGGGTTNDIESNTVDESVAVDVLEVSPEGALGCDVSVTMKGDKTAPPTRVWIAPDGQVRWTDPAHVGDPSLTFLLSLLATHLIPDNTASGTAWNRGGETFHLDVLTDDLVKVRVEGRFGANAAHGGTETGTVDYAPALLVPTHADVEVQGRDEQPSQSSEYNRHIVYVLVSDSKHPQH
ncbi:MAG TPA: hypothetical protein VHT05_14875 [Candidatus Elarobacter sp.]|jgi:hypothetical protein|nr:hypothetical protein [Candidatus Elarobacter sp.]